MIQVDTHVGVKGPATRWINEFIGSVPASVHNRAWKHLRVGSMTDIVTVLALAEADFTADLLHRRKTVLYTMNRMDLSSASCSTMLPTMHERPKNPKSWTCPRRISSRL